MHPRRELDEEQGCARWISRAGVFPAAPALLAAAAALPGI
jgi:hypothetical protein